MITSVNAEEEDEKEEMSLDEAIDKLGFGWFQIKLLFIAGMIFYISCNFTCHDATQSNATQRNATRPSAMQRKHTQPHAIQKNQTRMQYANIVRTRRSTQ